MEGTFNSRKVISEAGEKESDYNNERALESQNTGVSFFSRTRNESNSPISDEPVSPPASSAVVPTRSSSRIHWQGQLFNPSPWDYDDIGSPICVLEDETFRILSWNKELQKVSGIKSKKMQGWVKKRRDLLGVRLLLTQEPDKCSIFTFTAR